MFQDTVIKATKRLDYFDDAKSLNSWATVTIRNAAIDRLRQIKTRARLLEEAALQKLEEKRSRDARHHHDSDHLDAMMLCFQRLPKEVRHLLHRRYTLGESGDEIARELKISTDAVYQRLSRAHKQLRTMVEDELERLELHAPTTP